MVVDPDRTIALVGMMGSGKTTIGRLLALRLDRRLFDSDLEIEARTGKTVVEIFRDHGEQAFRDEEVRSVREALENPLPVVMAVAGGAVLRPETRSLLRRHATVVWLRAPIETLIQRVKEKPGDRPLIKDDPEGTMRRLYAEREPVYKEVADIVVDQGDLPPEGIADMIVEELTG